MQANISTHEMYIHAQCCNKLDTTPSVPSFKQHTWYIFTIVTLSFSLSLWSKLLNVTSLKKSAPEWPRNKLFSFYLIGFLHSETVVKELGAQSGIDPHLSVSSTTGPPLHHRDFSVLTKPFLSLLSQHTLRLFKKLGTQESIPAP